MNVTIDWVDLVTLLGAVQGFLLAAILAASRSNRTANRLLAALITAFTLYLLQKLYYSAGLIRTYPHLFGIAYPTPWLFGPLCYLYAVAASDRARRLDRRDVLHFAAPVIVVIATFPIYMMSAAEKIALLDRLVAGDPPSLLRVIDPFKYVSGIAYSAATVAYLSKHRRRVQNSYSRTERVNLLWLLWLTGAAAATWLLAIVARVANVIPVLAWRHADDLVSLAIAILVYAIGYMGLRQPEIFRYDRPDPAPTPESPIPSSPTLVVEPEVARVEQRERYERSGLTGTEARGLEAALLSLMNTEHPYRDPDLTLPDLAERLGTTPHKLSEVLNAELSQTFYDFINGYRVEDVRRRLANAESKNLNLLTLAMDAGFASKSTFNQAFKKQTGQTPSTYRRAAAG